MRDQLKTALSATAPDPGAAPLPSAGELAEKIISLKAAHTIEPAPARVGGRAAARAELPVTARIRSQTNIQRAVEAPTDSEIPPMPEARRH